MNDVNVADEGIYNEERYSRQARFNGIGPTGQQQLRQKHVLIIGAGALGSANAEVLVRAGVGELTIVDRDYVEWSNLQRQQLYTEDDVRQHLPKSIAAERHLAAINGEVRVHAHVMDVGARELEQLVAGIDLIIDASDNFATRFIINDIAQKHNIPWIYGACSGSYGITYTILPRDTPCLHCMIEMIPTDQGDSCDLDGIIAPAVQMVVAYQTAEALKLLTGQQHALHRKLITFDLWSNLHTRIDLQSIKKPACPSCGEQATYPFLMTSAETNLEATEKAAVLCGRDTVHIRPSADSFIPLLPAVQRIKQGENATVKVLAANSFLISVMLEELRFVLFADGRALIHGSSDVEEAKQAYRRLMSLIS